MQADPQQKPRAQQGPRPIRLWMLADQRPGHTSQLRGLEERLHAHASVEVRWLDAVAIKADWRDWRLKRWPGPAPEEGPDIVIGAGSASHGLILLARRVFGCMAAVLMRPSIPLFCYDAAIVPRHDHPPARKNILVTRGVMNTVKPRTHNAEATAHTFLIGGVSKHFAWSSAQVIEQIRQIVATHPEHPWTLTNSRRTPEDFTALLAKENFPQVQFFPHEETPKGWLAAQLMASAEVWVTPDSVSMVYEAITSGAATGLFSLEPLRRGRIHDGLEDILAQDLCTSFARWHASRKLTPPRQSLWEAERGAVWLLEKYQQWQAQHP